MKFDVSYKKKRDGKLVAADPETLPGKKVEARDQNNLERKVEKEVYVYLGRTLDEMINAETDPPKVKLVKE